MADENFNPKVQGTFRSITSLQEQFLGLRYLPLNTVWLLAHQVRNGKRVRKRYPKSLLF